MSAKLVRITAALEILFGHILSFVCTVVLWTRGGYTFDEMINVFALIGPILAAYLSAIINYSFAPDALRETTKLSVLASIFSVVFPLLFMAALISILYLRAYGFGITSMDQLFKAIGAVETIVGVYVGIIVKNLFSDTTASAA
jgi:hypothetical protein